MLRLQFRNLVRFRSNSIAKSTLQLEKANRRIARKQPELRIEHLEIRSILAADLSASLVGHELRIEGTEAADLISIDRSGDSLSVRGVSTRFAARDVTSISIRALGGNDRIEVFNHFTPTTSPNINIDGGAGNDSIFGSTLAETIHGGNFN